ncbi:sulfatase-like hydrolase/transferase, partial [Tropicimonas sp.]|uniref:sulfatase-like hydrolase/transferase n=1 Tax=Tropicimonas sp. TaxID=2067044 RepID=UPI003A85526A
MHFNQIFPNGRQALTLALALTAAGWAAEAQEAAGSADLPNVLVIMGDDIGWFNTSAYNSGMMGYTTPNIDSIAADGVRFTDAYGQQSCTAGRAAFITGQSPKRTGLLKIGMPGDPIGLQPEDPTIAEILKPMGYATGQFGKNHLGDLD